MRVEVAATRLAAAPALAAGAAYFALVFALGFVLGTLRNLIVAPRLGEGPAVLVELPLMLTASWLACGWLVARFAVPQSWPTRLLMGASALALLLAAELALGWLAFGLTVPRQLARYGTMPGAVGLAAQLLFGLLPLLRR